jgi:hypothetical protein
MATSQMLQLFVEQTAPSTQDVYPLEAEAWLFVDPSKQTVVREFECEKIGGLIASVAADVFPVAVPGNAFITVKLLPARGEEIELYGPSHAASPAISGIGAVVLRVTDIGWSVPDPAQLSVGRLVGAHVYVDQT